MSKQGSDTLQMIADCLIRHKSAGVLRAARVKQNQVPQWNVVQPFGEVENLLNVQTLVSGVFGTAVVVSILGQMQRLQTECRHGRSYPQRS